MTPGRLIHRLAIVVFLPTALVSLAVAADWTNSGGNVGRNGLTDAVGPDAAELAWSGGRPSIISWLPVTEGDRVFMIRQNAFPAEAPDDAVAVAMDLATGDELWAVPIPFTEGEWIPWIGGVRDGQLYVSRSANGQPAPLYALDVATGDILWDSDDDIEAFAYDGVVFAPDGDPIVGDFGSVTRIDSVDGSTVWSADRSCSVSGNCGGCATDDAVYIADAVFGGHVIKRFDIETGDFLYESTLMDGFTIQNSPFVGPDGTVYLSRTQNNETVDFFYAFNDNGSALEERWNIPAAWTTSAENAVGPDGSVYMLGPGRVVQKLDPANGDVLETSAPLADDGGNMSSRIAVDAAGRVYVSNGEFSQGRVYVFDGELNEIWSVAVPSINIGGPAIAADGTLVVCGTGTNVRAYRVAAPACPADLDGSGFVDIDDLLQLLTDWGGSGVPADINGDGLVDTDDLLILLAAWGPC